MPADPTAPVVRYIHTLAAGVADTRPDQGLLGRFVAHRDPIAFAALVDRHGPMILSLCRRALRNEHDAEDAFQATFLVLARRAGGIRKQDSVACWLYGVARRVAMKAKVAAARRGAREGRPVERETSDLLDEISVAEAREILDQELGRLPEKLRKPLVLCCLQGLARDEAALLLGWPVSILKSRLEQGRERLRERLSRRGLTLVGTLAMSLLGQRVAVAVPTALVETTAHAAVVFVTGGAAISVVSIQSAAFTREVLRTMVLKKLAKLTVLAMSVGLLVTGLAVYGPVVAAPAKVADKKSDPTTDEVKLQGSWEVVELVKSGAKVMPTEAVKGTVEFKGDGFRFIVSPNGMAEITRTAATFTLDPSKSPRAVDLTLTDGAQKGQTILGIYESDGVDLQLCVAGGPREARPTVFKAEEGEFVLFKLKRSKK